MPARPTLSNESVREVKAAVKGASTAEELRRALCVWLPAALGLTARQLATALVWSLGTVKEARARHARRGARGLQDGRRQPFAPGSAEALAAALKGAASVEQYQRIQCVLLPLLFGLTGKQVAAAVGVRRATVSQIQPQYRRGGLAALVRSGGTPAIPLSVAEKLRAAMKHARTVPEFCRAQCLLLRLVFEFSSGLVARIVGWRQDSVSHLHECYRRHGDAVLRGPGRGGRRWRLLTVKQEAAVLRKLAQGHYDRGFLMFPDIQRAFEQAAGCPLQVSVVVEILIRHRWIFAAVVTTPHQVRRPADVRKW